MESRRACEASEGSQVEGGEDPAIEVSDSRVRSRKWIDEVEEVSLLFWQQRRRMYAEYFGQGEMAEGV